MAKRIMHCVLTAIVCAIIAVLLALTMPRDAHAIPKSWRNAPQFTQGGVTYRVRGWQAVVVKTNGKRVNIPAEVKYRNKWYEVRAIWSTALKGAKTITIHADLETCETARLWSKNVQVRVTRTGLYRWLKRTGANVRRIHCEGCK